MAIKFNFKRPMAKSKETAAYEKPASKLEKTTGVLGKTASVILPIFKKDSHEEFVNEILREDEQIRNYVLQNPQYKHLLERKVGEAFKKYKNVLRGGRVIDSWDRITSSVGEICDIAGPATGGTGYAASLLEEGVETIPKALYGAYYVTKTGDWKAIPYWALFEAASLIPYLGDAIDFTNIYINRARKMTKNKAKKEFIRAIKSGNLEQKLAA